MNKTIVLFFLLALLASCTMVSPTILPTAKVPIYTGALSPLASTQTYTPMPTKTPTSLPTSTSTSTPEIEASLMLKRVTQAGGSIHGITIVGDIAFVGMGPRVGVIDISQHANPKLVTLSEILPGLVTQLLQISSDRLLVSSGKHLVLMDISHPEGLKLIEQLELKGTISAMVFDDSTNILYAGGAIYVEPGSLGYDGFIAAIDADPDSKLKLLGSVTMPEVPHSIAVGESSLFAGANGYEGGLYSILVKAPGELSRPQQVIASSPGTPLVPTGMQVIGKRLYLGYWGVEAYDITNPEQPAQIWRRSSTGLDIVTGFTVNGDQVYVTGFSIREPDIPVFAAFTAPDPITGSDVGEEASFTAIHRGDFIVADRSLNIFHTAGGQDLQPVGIYLPQVANATDAAVNERAVYVLDNGIGDGQSNAVLWVLRLPDLQPIGQVTTEFPNGYQEGIRDIALDGDRLYLATNDTLWVYDIHGSEPLLQGKVDMSAEQIEEIAATSLDGKQLLFAACSNGIFNKLNIYDLTDLQESAILVDSLNLDQGFGLHLTLNGSAIYILLDSTWDSYSSSKLYAIDYDVYSLKLNGSLTFMDGLYHMAAGDNLIILSGSSRSMNRSIISVIQTEPLRLLSTLTLDENGQDVAIVGENALVVVDGSWDFGGEEQLLLFDLLSPQESRQVDAMDIAYSDTHRVPILYFSPFIILANGAGGVEVLEYSR